MIFRGSVYSKALEMETGLTLVLPQNTAGKPPWKTAYLLHGLCGSHGNWVDNTLLPLYARDLPVAFVMPEVHRSFYADMRYGQKFFTYVTDELPEICRRSFNVSTAREDTAILGGSMGGYGALKCALTYPERYSLCCAMSSACLFMREQTAGLVALGSLDAVRNVLGEQLVRDFQGILGESLEPRAADDVSDLAGAAASLPVRPRIYACCGESDDLLAENRRYRDEMMRLGYDFTYEEWPGGHGWEYFDQALRRSLAFCYGV